MNENISANSTNINKINSNLKVSADSIDTYLDVDTELEYEFDSNIIVLHTNTINWLIRQDQDSLVLYLFYIACYKRQKINPVKATGTFCSTGLKWGKTKFQRAKNKLIEMELISDIKRRGANGFITGNYIMIKYIDNNKKLKQANLTTDPEIHPVVTPVGGFRDTNTNHSNINTNHSNINTCTLKKLNFSIKKAFGMDKRWFKDTYKNLKERLKSFTVDELCYAFENLLNEPGKWRLNNNGNLSLTWWLENDSRIEDMMNCHLKLDLTNDYVKEADIEKVKDSYSIISRQKNGLFIADSVIIGIIKKHIKGNDKDTQALANANGLIIKKYGKSFADSFITGDVGKKLIKEYNKVGHEKFSNKYGEKISYCLKINMKS
jgi:hypothetical protein